MPETDRTFSTSARLPASPRPPGLPPVLPPEPWVPSKPAPSADPAKPSRRCVLASAAGLLAFGGATAAAQAAPGAHPDAELLALCAEYTALDRAFVANSAATADLLVGAPGYDALFDEGDAMVPRIHELEVLITATPPHTVQGHLAKLEAARRSMLSNADDPDSDLMDDDAGLAFAAVEGMLAHLRRGGV